MLTFDPFNDRPSRTVRNTLSKMLEGCLGRREIFHEQPTDLLHRFPQPPYAAYIRDRIARYRAATTRMRSAIDSPMIQAAILYRHGLYFEAHEVLEPHWLAAAGEEREGLKGLIQAIGVFVHREAGHSAAAQKLARKAIDRLHRYGGAIREQEALDIPRLVAQLTHLIETPEDPGL
jgi:hypothetical protein